MLPNIRPDKSLPLQTQKSSEPYTPPAGRGGHDSNRPRADDVCGTAATDHKAKGTCALDQRRRLPGSARANAPSPLQLKRLRSGDERLVLDLQLDLLVLVGIIDERLLKAILPVKARAGIEQKLASVGVAGEGGPVELRGKRAAAARSAASQGARARVPRHAEAI